MYCKNCGKQLPESANVCGYCGTEVSIPDKNTVVADSNSTDEQIGFNDGDMTLDPSKKNIANLSGFGWKAIILWLLTWPLGYIWESPIFYIGYLSIKLSGAGYTETNANFLLILIFFLMGLIVGTLQWLILHQINNFSILWIPLTALGTAVGDGLFSLISLDAWLYPSLSGCVIGFVQWLVLRRYVGKAYLWVLINTLVAMITSQLYPQLENAFINTFLFQSIYGLLTGACLYLLIRVDHFRSIKQ